MTSLEKLSQPNLPHELPLEVTDNTVVQLVHTFQQGVNLNGGEDLTQEDHVRLELSRQAQDLLFRKYEALVHYKLRVDFHIRPQEDIYDDLVQEGGIGVLTALTKSDVTKLDADHPLASLTSYIGVYIYRNIQRGLNQNDTIRRPVHINEAVHRQDKHGDTPSINPARLRAARRARRLVSLDSGQGFGSNREYTDTEGRPRLKQDPVEKLVADTDDPSWPLDPNFGLRSLISNALKTALSEREREIIHQHFFQSLSLEQIAANFRLTRERIRQIEARALSILRASDRVKGLFDGYILRYPQTYYEEDYYADRAKPRNPDDPEDMTDEFLAELTGRTRSLVYEFSRYRQTPGLVRRMVNTQFRFAEQLHRQKVDPYEITDKLFESFNLADEQATSELVDAYNTEQDISQRHYDALQAKHEQISHMRHQAEKLDIKIKTERPLLRDFSYGSERFNNHLNYIKGLSVEYDRLTEEIEAVASEWDHYSLEGWLSRACWEYRLPANVTHAVLSSTLDGLNKISRAAQSSQINN